MSQNLMTNPLSCCNRLDGMKATRVTLAWVALLLGCTSTLLAQAPPAHPSKMTPRSSDTPNAFEVPAQTRTVATRLTAFSIPFKVDNSNENHIEVQLYVSRDRGQSWQFHSRQKPSVGEFPFRSSGDGEYWFALKTLDRNRQLIPDGKITQPELIVVVDTRIPELDASVRADAAGRVVCRWLARDPHLLPDTLRIRYRPVHASENADWIQVPVKLNPQLVGDTWSDQLGWWPASTDSLLLVRIEIADAAGNIAAQERTVATRRMAQLRSSQSTAVGSPSAVTGWRPSASPEHQADRSLQANMANQFNTDSNPFEHQPPVGSGVVGNQPFGAGSSHTTESHRSHAAARQGYPSDSARTDSIPGQTVRRPAAQSWPSQSLSWPGRPATVANTSEAPGGSPPTDPLLQTALPTTANRIPLGPTQVQQGMTVREEGDLIIAESTTHGRGVRYGSVDELPLHPQQRPSSDRSEDSPTDDNSAASNSSPSHYARPFPVSSQSRPNVHVARDDDRPFDDLPLNHARVPAHEASARQPFDSKSALTQSVNTRRFALHYQVHSVDPDSIARVVLWMTRDEGRHWESWATDPDLQSPILVDVDQEGRYGFRIVVHSADGLTGHAPAPGDAPEILVDVDWTRPTIKLTEAPYGRGPLAGHLIIQWQAADDHLAERPIQIFYATTSDGPWTILASRLPNNGQFAWKITDDTPPRVYLRVEAVDDAGNVAFDQTATPIDLTGLIPSGRILGLQKIDEQ